MADYNLTPTQSLILDILGSRYRLGENLWTFESKLQKQMDALEVMGLIWQMHGIVEHTLRAGLSDAGKDYVLSSTYAKVIDVPSPQEVAQGILDTLSWQSAWNETQSSANAYADKQPGSSHPPYWHKEDDLRVITDYLLGVRQPVFETRDMDRIFEVARELGLLPVLPTSHFPFRAAIKDQSRPAVSGWDAVSLFFYPDGRFYAAFGVRARIHIRADEFIDDDPVDTFLLQLRGHYENH